MLRKTPFLISFILWSMLILSTNVMPITAIKQPSRQGLQPVLVPQSPVCGPTVHFSGEITSETGWIAGYTYVMDDDVTVNAGVTLSIDEGVVVKLVNDASLYINGKILAVGTISHPVYFTSYKDDTLCGDTNGDGSATVPSTNDWGWIEFGVSSDNNSRIERTVVKYSGWDNDPWYNGAAIRLNIVSPTLEYITFASNYRNAVELVSGNWLTNDWNITTVVYWMSGDITIPAANTLTIAPGVKVKASNYSSLYINGKLLADGTQENPITFTSEKDDAVCGVGAAGEAICDTNNDGAGSVPAPQDWGWIEFRSGSDPTSVIRRAIIRYTGNNNPNVWNGAAIRLNFMSPTIEYITFTNNYRNAVELVGGNWLNNAWNMPTVVYWMSGDITVPAANTLTISPGVKIKVNRLNYLFGTTLYINGKLLADGTQESPITFTSEKDDSVCGVGAAGEAICDTNNDGTGSVPAPNDWASIEFGSGSDPTSIIRRAIIRYNGISNWDTSGAIRLNSISPTLEYITFTSNNRNAVELISGNWLNNTWNMTTVVYWYNNDIIIPAANTLTIAPGVKIKANNDSLLYINGKLLADGTQENPITFTSEEDDTVCGIGAAGEAICDTNNDATGSVPAPNDWGWIEFAPGSDATSIIRRAIIRYSGWDERNWSYNKAAIRLNSISPTLEYITFTRNYRNAVELVGGNWLTNAWNMTTVVYWLNGNSTIPSANTLTIAPGVKIKANNDSSLYINGKILADGTQENPITFTSEEDDTVCGIGAAGEAICDTNNDGTASVPTTNDWSGIEFGSSSDATSIIRDAIIRYGGASIRINGISPTIAYVLFKTNFRGLALFSGARPTLTCNDFVSNQDYGMYNNVPATIISAEGQWWNSYSGPTHASNPSGTGDRVTNGIDYTPWATTPCTYSPPPIVPLELVYIPFILK